MFGPPKEISGPGELAAWSRMLLRFLRTITLVDGPGYRIKRLPGGIALDLPLQPGGGGSLGISGPYHIKTVFDDYMDCVSWDPSNPTMEGTTTIHIAKDWKIRCSLTKETKFTIVHNYTYGAGPDANNKQRTDTPTGGTAEAQLVSPPWVVSAQDPVTMNWEGDVIWAAPATTLVTASDGSKIALLMLGTRAWTAPGT